MCGLCIGSHFCRFIIWCVIFLFMFLVTVASVCMSFCFCVCFKTLPPSDLKFLYNSPVPYTFSVFFLFFVVLPLWHFWVPFIYNGQFSFWFITNYFLKLVVPPTDADSTTKHAMSWKNSQMNIPSEAHNSNILFTHHCLHRISITFLLFKPSLLPSYRTWHFLLLPNLFHWFPPLFTVQVAHSLYFTVHPRPSIWIRFQ